MKITEEMVEAAEKARQNYYQHCAGNGTVRLAMRAAIEAAHLATGEAREGASSDAGSLDNPQTYHLCEPAAILQPKPCTCHPDDNPPVPCAQKYALSECRKAASPAAPQSAGLDAGTFKWAVDELVYAAKYKTSQASEYDAVMAFARALGGHANG